MNDLSIFIDESGDVGEVSKYYLVALVFHEQRDPICDQLERYHASLNERGLPTISMHAGPLINGNDDYARFDKEQRSKMLSSFRVLAQRLPFKYRCIAYRKSELGKHVDKFEERLLRDVKQTIIDNLEYVQSFVSVKIYYDNGQSVVTRILRQALEETVSKEALVYRNANPKNYAFLQVADYICTLELTEIKFQNHEATETDRIFFGTHAMFRKNFLRRLRKHYF